MQWSHLTALVEVVPELRAPVRPDPLLRQALASAGLPTAVAWIERVLDDPDGPAGLKALLRVAEPQRREPPGMPRPGRLRSGFAGLGLLLPAVRQLGLAERLGPAGLHRLLVAAIPPPARALAAGDAALRWLSGLPPHERPGDAEIDWPSAADAEGLRLASDVESHGDGPEMPALRMVLDAFAAGLPGMSGSSAAYLAAQFLARPGRLDRDARRLVVRVEGVPLRILLAMGGRLGPQGPLDWLDGRELVLEAPDG